MGHREPCTVPGTARAISSICEFAICVGEFGTSMAARDYDFLGYRSGSLFGIGIDATANPLERIVAWPRIEHARSGVFARDLEYTTAVTQSSGRATRENHRGKTSVQQRRILVRQRASYIKETCKIGEHSGSSEAAWEDSGRGATEGNAGRHLL